MKLRWGIVSAGRICNDFVVAVSTLADDEHEVVAVAAKDKKRAENFAMLHNVPLYYDSYQELADNNDIDIVYIGNLHPQHYEACILMLDAGKHVLCEKPLCMNKKQAKKLIMYAERKKLFLMEAIWSRFFPAYQYIRRQIETGVLGEIKEVEANFGFDLMTVDRLQRKSLGGGTVLDLGIYNIQICQWAFQEPPKSIKAKGELNDDGVDICMEAELIYSSGTAKIKTSAKELLENTAIIKGTKAHITLKDFWSPITLIDIDGKEKTWALPEAQAKCNFHNSVGLRYEAEEARKCIMSKKNQSDIVSHNESLLIAEIEDEIRKQIGVVYDEDKE